MEKIQAEQPQKVPEGKEKSKLPPLSIDIFYSPHGTAEDIEGLAERLKKADIFIPEFFNWDRNTLKIFRGVSDGKLNPDQGLEELGNIFFPGFVRKLLEIIHNSHVPVVFIDLSSKSPLVKPVRDSAFLNIDFGLNFGKELDSIRNSLKNINEANNKRNQYMLASFKPKIKELLKVYPKLQNKKKLNILLSLGSAHSPLYFEFKKETEEARRGFKEMPQTFGFYDEGLRREKFGKSLDDEFISRILLEKIFLSVLNSHLKSITKDSEKIERFLRWIVSKYHISEIETIYGEIKEAKDGREVYAKIGQSFKNKNIIFPRSEAELDEILSSR